MSHEVDLSADEAAGYRKLVECAPDALVAVDCRGRIVFLNSQAVALFGWPQTELLGQGMEILLPQRLRAQHVQARQEYHAAPVVRPMGQRQELLAARADGTEFPAEISLSPISVAGETLVVAAVRDVSERHEMRRELALNGQIQAALSALLRLALQPLSLQEQLQHALDLLLRLEWLRPRLQGAIFLAEGESSDLVLRAYQRCPPPAAGDQPAGEDWPLVQQRAVPVQRQPHLQDGCYCVPIVDRAGLLGVVDLHFADGLGELEDETRFLMAAADVLAGLIRRKQAEESLQASQERFELAVRGTDAGVWDWDLRTNRVHFASRWKSQLGYEDGEILDDFAEWESRLHPEDRQRALNTVQSYLSGQLAEYELEHRLRHKDGSYRWILARGGMVRDEAGVPCRMVGSHLDITERKRSEQVFKEHEAQLIAARTIQKHLLPRSAPQLPGFDIAGTSHAAYYAAGDYYDYLLLPDRTLALTIGDVSGHGFSSALLMASLSARLRVMAETTTDLAEVFRRVNCALVDDTEHGRFVTLLMVRLDPHTRQLEFVSAGHTTGYVLDAAGVPTEALSSNAPPLGIVPDVHFETVRAGAIDRGGHILLMTDGLIEARSPEGEEFGVERVLDLVRAHRQEDSQSIIRRLHGAIKEFTQSEELQDDVTVLIAQSVSAAP